MANNTTVSDPCQTGWSEENAAFLAAIVDSSDDAIIGKTTEGIVTSWNRAAERIYGYSAREIIGKSVSMLFPEESGEDLSQILEKIKRLERVDHYETLRRRKDGKIINVAISVSPIRDKAGKVIGASTIGRDITERKRLEEELREAREWFQVTLHSIGDAVIATDSSGNVTFLNPIAARLTGWSPEEAAGRPLCEVFRIVNEKSRKPAENIVERVLNDGRVVNLANHTALLARDGRETPIEDSAAPIRDSSGNIIGVVLIFHDVTERRRAEHKLNSSKALLQDIESLTRVGGWEYDCASKRMTWTDEVYRIYGVSPRAWDPNDIEHHISFYCPNDREIIRKAFDCALEHAKPFDLELSVLKPTGEQAWVRTIGQPEVRGDRTLRIYGNIMDITDRKRLEQEQERVRAQLRQAQKMEALGTLAGGIAHDFNNVLGIIMGYTEMAKLELEPKHPVAANLDEILGASNRAKALVKQILAFSRRTEQQKMSLQLSLVVKEAMQILRPSLPSTIEIKLKAHSKACVLADPTQMHQVLMNLCANAAHAMHENGGVLEVGLKDIVLSEISDWQDLALGKYVELTVRDTGCGIDPRIMELIFDPFFTTKGVGEGTGLGLSVVHGIVKSHGGDIKVQSTKGKGTAFTLLLPALENGTPGHKTCRQSCLPRGQERVLVVDDEPLLAAMVKKMLEKQGYDVVSRTNGIEALEAFRNQPADKKFDLVITDMTMPHCTGAELAREILKSEPSVPVILMTGFSSKIDSQLVKTLGIKALLMKPVAIGDLAANVRKVLDQRALQD
ncbi:MAG: PAS domain S-box protein [Syntrophobacteraceae bacterium]